MNTPTEDRFCYVSQPSLDKGAVIAIDDGIYTIPWLFRKLMARISWSFKKRRIIYRPSYATIMDVSSTTITVDNWKP